MLSNGTTWFRSRGTLLCVWTLPFVVVILLLIYRPYYSSDDITSLSVADSIRAVATVFLPPFSAMASFWVTDTRGTARPALTKPRFWLAFWTIIGFHSVMLIYFLTNVFFPDYSRAETCPEMLFGRLYAYASLASLFAGIVVIPVYFLFSPAKST